MHTLKILISTAMGLGALLDVLSVASLLEGLPRHVLLDVLALLPGGGAALPAGDVEQFSSSSYLVMVAGTLRQTSSGMSLHTSRGVETSSHTCLGTWLHCLLVTVEHLRSETSLVWILGTREQTRLDFCWQSLTGTSWQDWRLSSWQSTLGTWTHLIWGTS